MLIYLGLSAVIAVGTALALLLLDELPRLAALHLVFSVAILPLIVGAMTYFIPVLTRTGGAPRRVLLLPMLLQLAGVLVVLYFSGATGSALLALAAGIDGLIVAVFSGWLLSRVRRTLGQPHPCWRWYLAALLCLLLGLAMILALQVWPGQRQPLRLLHAHLNTLGLVGLTALATLQVLLPTVLSGPDQAATRRLQEDLPLAFCGVLLTGVGAAFWWPLSLVGAAFLAYVAGRPGVAWLRRYGLRQILDDGAAAALLAALCGFLLLLALGVMHASGWSSGSDLVPAFVAAFLLPLVTGALSQLLPVWRYSGQRVSERVRMRATLIHGGVWRSLFFLAAGGLLALGHAEGLWLAAGGLGGFVVALFRSLLCAVEPKY
jgi:hypothetical protein